MKKLIFLLIVCILLLCGCGRDTKTLSGWVEDYIYTENSTYPVIVIRDYNNKQYGIAVDENTFMYSWIDTEEAEQMVEKLKNGTAEDVKVLAHYRGGFHNTKTEEGNIKTVKATITSVYSVITREAYALKDGTLLDMADDGYSKTYLLADGTELMRVNYPTGPENVYSGVYYSFDSFTEEAQKKVAEYYDDRGLLYDETKILEQAYIHYSSNPSDFHTYLLERSVSPAAGNEKIISFLTSVTIPLENGRNGQEIRLGEIFDIKTGEHISGYDIFNCDAEKAVDILIDAAFGDAASYYSESTNGDIRLKEQMKQNMKPEYIILWNENLEIAFPAGTLEGQEHCFLVGIDYTDEIKAIIHDWAIPNTAW